MAQLNETNVSTGPSRLQAVGASATGIQLVPLGHGQQSPYRCREYSSPSRFQASPLAALGDLNPADEVSVRIRHVGFEARFTDSFDRS
jgi:hypothetical protein